MVWMVLLCAVGLAHAQFQGQPGTNFGSNENIGFGRRPGIEILNGIFGQLAGTGFRRFQGLNGFEVQQGGVPGRPRVSGFDRLQGNGFGGPQMVRFVGTGGRGVGGSQSGFRVPYGGSFGGPSINGFGGPTVNGFSGQQYGDLGGSRGEGFGSLRGFGDGLSGTRLNQGFSQPGFRYQVPGQRFRREDFQNVTLKSNNNDINTIEYARHKRKKRQIYTNGQNERKYYGYNQALNYPNYPGQRSNNGLGNFIMRTNSYRTPQPVSAYGVPSSKPEYGVPYSAPAYGPPSPMPAYGVPPQKLEYGVPTPTPAYGVLPPAPTYGLPSPTPAYAIPPKKSEYGEPTKTTSYGLPTPAPTYGLPSPTPAYGIPPKKSEYGEPPPTTSYGVPTPAPTYGLPSLTPAYGIPQTKSEYSEPPPTTAYGVPPPTPTYGLSPPTPVPPQKSEYGEPPLTPAYGVPPPAPTYELPLATPAYGTHPQKSEYGIPPPTSEYGVPHPSPAYGVPSHSSIYEETTLQPEYGLPSPSPDYGPPQPPSEYGLYPPISESELQHQRELESQRGVRESSQEDYAGGHTSSQVDFSLPSSKAVNLQEATSNQETMGYVSSGNTESKALVASCSQPASAAGYDINISPVNVPTSSLHGVPPYLNLKVDYSPILHTNVVNSAAASSQAPISILPNNANSRPLDIYDRAVPTLPLESEIDRGFQPSTFYSNI